MSAPEVLLALDDIHAGFGATTVLNGVSFVVRTGEVAGLFGLNGAGKSVTLKVLAGIVPARSGRLGFAGQVITDLPAEDRVALGMAHVPQGRQVFPGLTVEQNLRLGAYPLRRRDKSRYASVLDGVYDRFPVLRERRDQLAGTMSGGQQASLAVGRALMAEPKLILIDEPSAGLAPLIVAELFETLQAVAASGVTMLLVEQNVSFGFRLVDRAHILQTGRIVYTGEVGAVDRDEVAQLLGVGRLLGGGVTETLSSRKKVTTS